MNGGLFSATPPSKTWQSVIKSSLLTEECRKCFGICFRMKLRWSGIEASKACFTARAREWHIHFTCAHSLLISWILVYTEFLHPATLLAPSEAKLIHLDKFKLFLSRICCTASNSFSAVALTTSTRPRKSSWIHCSFSS